VWQRRGVEQEAAPRRRPLVAEAAPLPRLVEHRLHALDQPLAVGRHALQRPSPDLVRVEARAGPLPHRRGHRRGFGLDDADVRRVEEHVPPAPALGGDHGQAGEQVLDARPHRPLRGGEAEPDAAAREARVHGRRVEQLAGRAVEPVRVAQGRSHRLAVGALGRALLGRRLHHERQALHPGRQLVALEGREPRVVDRVPRLRDARQRAEDALVGEGVGAAEEGRDTAGLERLDLPLGVRRHQAAVPRVPAQVLLDVRADALHPARPVLVAPARVDHDPRRIAAQGVEDAVDGVRAARERPVAHVEHGGPRGQQRVLAEEVARRRERAAQPVARTLEPAPGTPERGPQGAERQAAEHRHAPEPTRGGSFTATR